MDWISKILENKISAKLVALLFITSGGLLFLPDSLIRMLRLNDFIQEYGKYIGVTFLLSASFLIITFILWCGKTIRQHRQQTKKKADLEASIIEAILNLDPHEQAVLREFFIQKKNTIQLPIDQHIVTGLLRKGIITIAGSSGQASLAGALFPVNLSSYAKNYINEQVVGFPEIKGKPTEEQIRFIIESRPRFIETIERHNWLREG